MPEQRNTPRWTTVKYGNQQPGTTQTTLTWLQQHTISQCSINFVIIPESSPNHPRAQIVFSLVCFTTFDPSVIWLNTMTSSGPDEVALCSWRLVLWELYRTVPGEIDTMLPTDWPTKSIAGSHGIEFWHWNIAKKCPILWRRCSMNIYSYP